MGLYVKKYIPNIHLDTFVIKKSSNNNKDMIFLFTGCLTPIKIVKTSFPQGNFSTCIQGGYLAFTPLES